MKKNQLLIAPAMLVLLLVLAQACKKDDGSNDDDTPDANQSPTVSITSPANGAEIIKGSNITVTASASDPDGSISMVRFYMNGSERGEDSEAPYTFTWNTVNEIEGNNILRVTAWDDQFKYGYDEINVSVKDTSSDPVPVAAFSADVVSGEPPLTVTFTDESLNDPILWYWSFGDPGGSSVEQNPTHTYEEEGVYTVSLIVRNEYGRDTLIKEDYINVSIVVTTGSFTDPRDGQEYATITLGGQTWFAENLNYKAADSWWYDFNAQNGELYGRLYLWSSALTACPPGWHLPSDDEYKDFEIYIGMSPGIADYTGFRGPPAGKFMKSTEGWFEEGNGDNHSGFNGLPGGARFEEWNFAYIIEEGRWWTSTPAPTDAAWIRRLQYDEDGAGRYAMMQHFAASVRCIKD